MARDEIFRRFKVAVWNPTPSSVSGRLAAVEENLRKLGPCDLEAVKSIEDCARDKFDVVVCTAIFIGEDEFLTWIKGLEKRIPTHNFIKIPFIIISDVPSYVFRDAMMMAVHLNWYFDVVSSAHLESLPIRVLNFLRLHDHLHEVKRLVDAVEDLENQVQSLEEELILIKSQKS